MVLLHVKKGDQSQFLFDTTVTQPVDEAIAEITHIYNGRLKVRRIADEMEELAKHGVCLPPNMQGLTDDQVKDLKLVDEWGEKCVPSGGFEERRDEMGRRNGKAPLANMVEVLKKTGNEAKELISKDLVTKGVPMTKEKVKEALSILEGACTIVYPMGLPPYDPIRLEFSNEEDLTGTQASLEVMDDVSKVCLYFCGKELIRGKKLSDHMGRNEKTKVIVKIQRAGQGAPAREAVVSEKDQRDMMLYYHKKQEEWKKLEKDAVEDPTLTMEDGGDLKRSMQGLKGDIRWH